MSLMQTLFGGGGAATPWGPQSQALQSLYEQVPGLLNQQNYEPAALMGAESALGQTIGGAYLPGGSMGRLFNENLQAQFRQAMPGVTSAFARGGRGGSGLVTQALGQTFGDIYSGLYGQERQNQMQALGMAPSVYGARQNLALQPYQVAAQIYGTGPQMQQSAQTPGLIPSLANTAAGFYGLSNMFGGGRTPSLMSSPGPFTPWRPRG